MRKSNHGGSRWSLIFGAALIAIQATSAWMSKAETLDGFVTYVSSASNFTIGTLHVVMDETTRCHSETLYSNVKVLSKSNFVLARQYFALRDQAIQKSAVLLPCSKLKLRVGSRVRITGNRTGTNCSVRAAQVTSFSVTIRQRFATVWTNHDLEDGALIEEEPDVKRTDHGWTGSLWLDGYPMTVSLDTIVRAAPSNTELSYRSFGFLGEPRWGTTPPHSDGSILREALFKPDTWAAYRAAGHVEGFVMLEWVRYWPNQVNRKEKEFAAQLTPYVRAPDYAAHVPGTVGFPDEPAEKNLKILPAHDVQEFLDEIGRSVIPEYQQGLPESADTKIHFRFYVIQSERFTSEDEMSEIDGPMLLSRQDLNHAIVALPNGVILLSDYVLTRIANEAQLASILSYAVTVVLQKQSYISHNSRPGSMWEPNGENTSRFLFPLSRNEQSLRIGIRQMYLAGYDIREAPFAWAATQGSPVNNPAVDSLHPDKGIPWYAAYAFDYISKYYAEANYNKLKRGEKEYAQFLDELRHADPGAFAKRVGPDAEGAK
jgi:hypothetical protein